MNTQRDIGTTSKPPSLVDQRPAIAWMSLLGYLLVGAVLDAGLLGVAFFVANGSLRTLLAAIALVIAAVITSVGSCVSVAATRAGRRERRAGYTTLYGGPNDLWQLDPTTGDVVRPPSSPPKYGSRPGRRQT